jgi:hypothetical protein
MWVTTISKSKPGSVMEILPIPRRPQLIHPLQKPRVLVGIRVVLGPGWLVRGSKTPFYCLAPSATDTAFKADESATLADGFDAFAVADFKGFEDGFAK